MPALASFTTKVRRHLVSTLSARRADSSRKSNAEYDRQMAIARKYMARYRNALEELAKE